MSVEELVKELRHVSAFPRPIHKTPFLMEQAADKLEELAERARYAEGVAFLAMQRVGKAEAALAEAKREHEALRGQRDFLQEILDTRPAINAALPESYIRWSQSLYSGEVARASLSARNPGGNDEPCRGCGDGDKVPASGYWRCPVCDAEWSDEDAE